MLPHETELLSQLRSREVWLDWGGEERVKKLLSQEILKSKDAKLILRALSSWHRNGNERQVSREDLTRIATNLSGRDEVRPAIERLGEPFGKDTARECIWGVLSRIYITSAHERLVHAASNGGASPQALTEVIRAWESLAGASSTSLGERGPRSVRDRDRGEPQTTHQRLPTLLHSKLDEAIGGGLRRGELGLFVAPTNHGKTTTMLRTGVGLAQRGHRVLYISFEIYRDQIIDRVRTLCGKKLPATLYAEDYPSDEMTAGDVCRVADGVKDLDCLIVDHLDLMAHDQLDLVNAHGLAIRELRKYARKRNLVVWVPAQADDPTIGQMWLRPDQTYGSRQKRHASDLALGSLYLPHRKMQTFHLWKTRHTHMGLTYSLLADMVEMKFKEM